MTFTITVLRDLLPLASGATSTINIINKTSIGKLPTDEVLFYVNSTHEENAAIYLATKMMLC